MTFCIGCRETSDRPESVRKEGTQCWFLSRNGWCRQSCRKASVCLWVRCECMREEDAANFLSPSASASIASVASPTRRECNIRMRETKAHSMCSVLSSRRANLWGLHNTHRLIGREAESDKDRYTLTRERETTCVFVYTSDERIHMVLRQWQVYFETYPTFLFYNTLKYPDILEHVSKIAALKSSERGKERCGLKLQNWKALRRSLKSGREHLHDDGVMAGEELDEDWTERTVCEHFLSRRSISTLSSFCRETPPHSLRRQEQAEASTIFGRMFYTPVSPVLFLVSLHSRNEKP